MNSEISNINELYQQIRNSIDLAQHNLNDKITLAALENAVDCIERIIEVLE